MLASAGGLDGGVQRQEVGLLGDFADGVHDGADFAQAGFQAFFLGVEGLAGFGFAFGGDVGQCAHHAQRHALCVAAGGALGAKPAVHAVFHLQPVFNMVGRAAAGVVEVGGKGLDGAVFVFRVQAAGPAVQHIGKIPLVAKAQQGAELIRPPERVFRVDRVAGDDFHVPQAFAEHAARHVKALQRYPQHVLLAALVVDVGQRAGHAQRHALCVALGGAARAKPAVAAVFQLQAVVDVVGGAAAAVVQVGGKGGQHAVFVFRVQAVGPAAQHIGKVAFVMKTQQGAKLIGPPKFIGRVDGITGLHGHVP